MTLYQMTLCEALVNSIASRHMAEVLTFPVDTWPELDTVRHGKNMVTKENRLDITPDPGGQCVQPASHVLCIDTCGAALQLAEAHKVL